jgi:hypothetical protein
MDGETGDVLHNFDLQHKGLYGHSLSKGECSSIEEDAPTSTKHGHRNHVRGKVRGRIPGEVIVRGIH